MSEERVTRRGMIQRGAIVAGAVWAAPAITTVSSVSAAGSPICASKTTFGAKYQPQVEPCDNGVGQNDCSPGRAAFSSGCAQVGDANVTENADGTWTLDLGPDCTFVSGCSKCGGDGEVPGVASNNGHTVTYSPCPKNNNQPGFNDISHIEAIFECCD